MIIDLGFTHSIAKNVLKDDPENLSAKKILSYPENKITCCKNIIVNLADKKKCIVIPSIKKLKICKNCSKLCSLKKHLSI